MWSYNEIQGDLTSKPVGDSLFASIFSDSFRKWVDQFSLNYKNESVWNQYTSQLYVSVLVFDIQ